MGGTRLRFYASFLWFSSFLDLLSYLLWNYIFCSDADIMCDLEVIFLLLWKSYLIYLNVQFAHQSPRCVIYIQSLYVHITPKWIVHILDVQLPD